MKNVSFLLLGNNNAGEYQHGGGQHEGCTTRSAPDVRGLRVTGRRSHHHD